MPNCYYYDEQRNRCSCYVNENPNELLEENVNLRVQFANAMVTVRRVDERCAKLRELCADLHRLVDETYVPFGSENKWMDDFTNIERRMRELGIEVSE